MPLARFINTSLTRAEWKHRTVYAVVSVLKDEMGYATVADITCRLRAIDLDPEQWDYATPATVTVRNSLNALMGRGLVGIEEGHGQLRWHPL